MRKLDDNLWVWSGRAGVVYAGRWFASVNVAYRAGVAVAVKRYRRIPYVSVTVGRQVGLG